MAGNPKNNSNKMSSQNIDDILQLLKTSYEEDSSNALEDSVHIDTEDISKEDLQSELRKIFMRDSELGSEDTNDDDSYTLDADFLREVNSSHDKKIANESIFAKAETASETQQNNVENNSKQIDRAPWESAEVESNNIADSDEEDNEPEVILLSDVSELLNEELVNDLEYLESIDTESLDIDSFVKADENSEEEIILVPNTDDALTLEEDEEQEIIVDEPEMMPLDLNELNEEDIDVPITVEEEIVQLHEEEQEKLLATEYKEEEPLSELDHSVIELLLQLGCKDELEETIGEDGIEEYYAARDAEPLDVTTSYAYNGEEYVSREQNEDITNRYKKAFQKSIINVFALIAFSFAILLYDILPLFEVEFFWIFDHSKNPIVYLLFGLQLLLIGCIIPIKKLLRGLKNIIFSRPDGYSIAAISVITISIYDISLFFTKFDEFPITFHFLGIISVLCAVVADHFALCAERKIFSVYSKSGKAYTLLRDDKEGSIADKMYRGGMDTSQKVRVPSTVDFPTRYFHAVHEKHKISNPILRSFFTPTVILSVLAGVFCMILDIDVSSSLSAMWIILLFSMPVAYILCDEILLYIASYKLFKRGCAITSRESINKYGDTDVIVFNDTHLFSACEADKVGIVFYNQKNALNVLVALDALYTKIGGPMMNIFKNIPSDFKYDCIAILRAFRNGIEAIVDKKHLLIVGDISFMKRYGFDFNDNVKESSSRSVLCVSFDGKKSAKINVQYKIEPLFEILIERMAENDTYCAVETYDPLINGALVKRLRKFGNIPVSIVHKTAKDIYMEERQRDSRKEETGLLVGSSRLKLAEAVIWCKHLISIRKIVAVISVVGGAVAFVAATVLNLLGAMKWTNQYVLLAYKAIWIAFILMLGILKMPRKNYFSRSAIEKKKKSERKNHE